MPLEPEKQRTNEEEMPDFGEPLDFADLIALTEFDEADVEDAMLWWDMYTTDPRWIGALE